MSNSGLTVSITCRQHFDVVVVCRRRQRHTTDNSAAVLCGAATAAAVVLKLEVIEDLTLQSGNLVTFLKYFF